MWTLLAGETDGESCSVDVVTNGDFCSVSVSKIFVQCCLTPLVKEVRDEVERLSGRVIWGLCGTDDSLLAPLIHKCLPDQTYVLELSAYQTVSSKKIHMGKLAGDLAWLVSPKASDPLQLSNIPWNEDIIGMQPKVKVVLLEGVDLLSGSEEWAVILKYLKSVTSCSRNPCTTASKEMKTLSLEPVSQVVHTLSNSFRLTSHLERITRYESESCSTGPPQALLVLGPNPALQKTLVFNSGWMRDHVNRADVLQIGLGGKGQQFAKAACVLNKCHVHLLQFVGGGNGTLVEKLLMPYHFTTSVRTKAETRACTSLVAPSGVTELIEPSGRVNGEELAEFIAIATQKIRTGQFKAIALCGTTPPGAESLYETVGCIAVKHNVQIFLDGYLNVDNLLNSVSILKVNQFEIEQLVNHLLNINVTELTDAVQLLFERLPRLESVLITCGPDPSYAFRRQDFVLGRSWFEFRLMKALPKEDIINVIGCGDTCGAVFLSSFSAGVGLVDSFRNGLAAATASCKSLQGAEFQPDDYLHFKNEISVVHVCEL